MDIEQSDQGVTYLQGNSQFSFGVGQVLLMLFGDVKVVFFSIGCGFKIAHHQRFSLGGGLPHYIGTVDGNFVILFEKLLAQNPGTLIEYNVPCFGVN